LYHVCVPFLVWLTEGARLFATCPYAAVQLPSFPLWLLLEVLHDRGGRLAVVGAS
jgi:hypothetical protein